MAGWGTHSQHRDEAAPLSDRAGIPPAGSPPAGSPRAARSRGARWGRRRTVQTGGPVGAPRSLGNRRPGEGGSRRHPGARTAGRGRGRSRGDSLTWTCLPGGTWGEGGTVRAGHTHTHTLVSEITAGLFIFINLSPLKHKAYLTYLFIGQEFSYKTLTRDHCQEATGL